MVSYKFRLAWSPLNFSIEKTFLALVGVSQTEHLEM
jgi:hypothetical protein